MTNIVVNDGKNLTLKRILGGPANPAIFIGLGKSQTVPTNDTTSLGQECISVTETGYQRIAGAITYNTGDKTAVAEATFNNANISVPTTIYEIGLFDSQTGGNLFAISKIGGISKNGDLSIKVRLTIGIE